MTRHAEIAGGGIGGLGLGIMLARHGWSVRIHERSPAIREIGAGIALRNNCITALEHHGVFARLEPLGSPLRQELSIDATGRVMQTRAIDAHHRTHVLPRQALVDGLAQAAREAGAEIVTSSHIVRADPAGLLVDAAGREFRGDLVVGADGINSKVRDTLGVGVVRKQIPVRVNRYLMATRAFVHDGVMEEHWSGGLRVGFLPSGPGQSFVYLVAPARDEGACRMPVDPVYWSAAFPRLRDAFDLIGVADGTQYPYQLVRCSAWSCGRVALLGDAAHGMPPTLGQGAGLALMNAHALAELVSGPLPVEQALVRWEATIRDIAELTQRWSVRYDRFTRHFPLSLRPGVIWAFDRFPTLNERMRIADNGLALIDARLA